MKIRIDKTFIRKAFWYALDISIAIGMPLVAVWYTLNYASSAIAATTLTLAGPIAAMLENAVAKIYHKWREKDATSLGSHMNLAGFV